MNEPVTAFDLARMFIGDEPPLFMLEIILRTVIIYGYTLVLIRWIGSRSIGQLSLVEFLLVIALGSAVGDSMFYPDVPLFHCMIVITVVILLDKALSYFVSRHPKLEQAVEGKSIELVRDGLINVQSLKKANLAQDELFEMLRLKDVANLKEVRAVYLETNGMVSVFKAEDASEPSGLSIEPPWDSRPPVLVRTGDTSRDALACTNCGMVIDALEGLVPKCPRCDSDRWHRAA